MIPLLALVTIVSTLPRTASSVESHSFLRRPREHDVDDPSTPDDDAARQKGFEQPDPLHGALWRSRLLLEAATVPYVGGGLCASGVGAAVLERHTAAVHGDVCRCEQACQRAAVLVGNCVRHVSPVT
jgi:hypothetical protein